MPEKSILTESYGAVLVDEQVPCVIIQFTGFANQAEFKHIMETGLAYFTAHSRPEKPWGWIGDVRHMSAIPQPVQDWLINEWNHRAFTAGVREVSIVTAENPLGSVATQQYVRNTQARADQYEISTEYYPGMAAAKRGAKAALKR